jgi:uncharacterized BrkB/YihY/UPF0761 family membrane protein
MPPEIQKALLEGFQQIADAISKIAPEAWAVFLRQQMIMGAWGLITTFLSLIGGSIGLHKNVNRAMKADYESGEQIIGTVLAIVFGVIAVVGFIMLVTSGGDNFGRLLNPGYYAVRDIFSMITGK